MEKQESHPSAGEMPRGERETATAKELAEVPSIDQLDTILREAERVAKIASMSEKEIDEAIEQRQEALDRLQKLDVIRESRLKRVENFNPLRELTPSDYERLVQEGVIDPERAERLNKIDKLIEELESLDFPSAEAKAELEKLSEIRNDFRKRIESQIAELQQEIAERREEVISKVLQHYARRAAELERIIAEIESNPRVVERLHTIAERERQAFQTQIEQERKKIIQEASRYIQSLSARHANAFKRMGELVGNENIANKLIEIIREGNEQKYRNVFDNIRSRLIAAIIDGEGEKQLEDPREVVPWKIRPTSIPYEDAINFLRFYGTEETLRAAADAGDEQAKKLLEQREQVIAGNEAIRRIVGPQWITDRKTGKKRLGAFWAAFETRKENDQKGITAARKKEREEAAKREAEFRKNAKQIIDRGGFIAEVPVFEEIKGKRVIVGKQRGVVRLEKRKSKKGNDFWQVVEVYGTTNGLKVGDASPLDMRSFPEWLRESANLHFVKQGANYVERLT
jgi:hypothetical protein